MKLLFIGDIVGRPGRQAVRDLLPALRREYDDPLVVANAENASGGRGLTKENAAELYDAGVHFITMGNHVWDNRQILDFIDDDPRLIRPANYPAGAPGRGTGVVTRQGRKVGILNLSGRVFMAPLDNPFALAGQLAAGLRRETPLVIMDFHAEATSEKQAMGWFMDGKVSAVLGTHTHVQTADARILPKGAAYITDVGMTGPADSVLGVKKEIIINSFLSQMPARFDVAGGETRQFNAVLLTLDEQTGKAAEIETIQRLL
ncbi:MAG: TIGR00282 family metallophosphoesterase [Gracilibacteraceae bacterium]|jgi:metallophosphoesterase (TIGR00282 family)|nr:TIGR00282 family metallophosphoesterase [Gracilibacteraceae bacterium]